VKVIMSRNVTVDRAITLRGIAVTKSVRKAIEEAGGKVE
jgi:ribosomal protein L15